MPALTRNDYSTTLAVLARLEALAGERGAFLHAVLEALGDLVPYEQACVCDGAWPAKACPAPGAQARPFRAMVRLAAGDGSAVRIELQRSRRDFSPRDRERLSLLEPHLAFLALHAGGPLACAPVGPPAPIAFHRRGGAPGVALTPREGDVMHWLACGKTDADIGVLLAISPRTVHKHLEHIYAKLGVETRTAAVMAVRRGAAGVRGPSGDSA